MIVTEQQRRWWFATHPEYGHKKSTAHGQQEKQSKMPPEEVDKFVDEKLKYERNPVIVELLKQAKRYFGTEEEDPERKKQLEFQREAEKEYSEGWWEAYLGVYGNKPPPDIKGREDSHYAKGLIDGAAYALDEIERRNQFWDFFPSSLASQHRRDLRNNLTEKIGPCPSSDYDGHHIVPWRHWRAEVARKILEKWDIGIDTIDNGMWLERSIHYHLSNNYGYMDAVNNMLKGARSKKQALKVLDDIRDSLAKGKIPK